MTGMANAIEGFYRLRHGAVACHYRDGFDLVGSRHDHRLDFNYVANGDDLCAYCSSGIDPIAFAIIGIIAIRSLHTALVSCFIRSNLPSQALTRIWM